MMIAVTRSTPTLRIALSLLIALAAPRACRAFDWQDGCRPFIAPAEQYYQLPPGLLASIAMVESGRDGMPYPWALNIAGESVMAPDYATAARLLRGPDGTPRRDIAIGCLQIHMQYHLQKFGAPEWALHPRYNVWYGARFLRFLKEKYGNWGAAIGHYHASDPTAQRDYLCRVSHYLERSRPDIQRQLAWPSCGAASMPPAPDGWQAVMAARQRAPMQLQGGAP